MILRSSPMEQMVLDQIKWGQRRRIRILGTISSHFNRQRVQTALQSLSPPIQEFNLELPLNDILDENEPYDFLKKLAYTLEFDEARMIKALQKTFATEITALNNQILIGARHAGQEAARLYHSSHNKHEINNLTELFYAISQLTYSGLPSEKSWFSSIRPMSDLLIHYKSCAHIQAWREAGADTKFMCEMQSNWIEGILDILSPNIVHIRSASIARGDSYGKDQFIPKEKYVPLNQL